MTAGAIKGWCPGALRPMESGDGLIVRLKITGGIVPLDLAAAIADWSARWGNGEIDLTSRANLQLRGVSAESLSELQSALAAHGLLDGNIGGEAVRNVISSPLAGLDPEAVLDVRPLARDLEVRLRDDTALHDLPAKFGFLIDDGGRLGLRDVRADVRFEAVLGADAPGFVVGLDGDGDAVGVCRPDEFVETAAALARVFLAHREPDVRRMRDLVERVGAAGIAADASLSASPLEGEVGNGLALPGGGAGAAIGLIDLRDQYPPPAAADAASTSPSRGEAMEMGAFVGVGLPFGRIAAMELANLVQSVADSGATEFRLTPWRAILIPLPTAAGAKTLAEKLAHTGLILDSADPRLRVAACSGAPSCLHGTTATRSDATQLAALVGTDSFLHLSGCAKGCAHPRSAPVTLVGRDGLYDLVIDGAPSDLPSIRGLTLDEAAEHLRQMAAQHSQGGTA
jgi:precorrin-3B synthase